MAVGRTTSGKEFTVPLSPGLLTQFSEKDILEVYAVCYYQNHKYQSLLRPDLANIYAKEIDSIVLHYGGPIHFYNLGRKFGFNSVVDFFRAGRKLTIK